MYRGLSESRACPSFENLTEEEDPSMDYYDGWEMGVVTPALNWCYLSEIVLPTYHLRNCKGFERTKASYCILS